MVKFNSIVVFALIGACICSGLTVGQIVVPDGYAVESFVTIPRTIAPYGKGMEFDTDGNLYLASNYAGGSVFKITPDGTIQLFASDMSIPQEAVMSSGVDYGENLYVADYSHRSIKRVALDGALDTFSSLPARPVGITMDETGGYGNKLFASTRTTSAIWTIQPDGSYSPFVEFPFHGDEWVVDIDIDPTGRYGGLMYAAVINPSGSDNMGVFSIDSEGKVERFLRNDFGLGVMEFDTTDGGLFGGGLLWGNREKIINIDPSGEYTVFLTSDVFIRTFDFAPDGSMYVLQYEIDGPAYIDRVYAVTENTLPIADAGDDQVAPAWVDYLAAVSLDGSMSSDPDGDELQYSWTWEVDGQAFEADGTYPVVQLPVGIHEISLIVNDGTDDSTPDTVVVEVLNPVETALSIVPKTVNRQAGLKNIMGMITLPDEVKVADLDLDQPFAVFPGETYTATVKTAGKSKLFVLVNTADMLTSATNTGQIEFTFVGKLATGQYLFGKDTVKIVEPQSSKDSSQKVKQVRAENESKSVKKTQKRPSRASSRSTQR